MHPRIIIKIETIVIMSRESLEIGLTIRSRFHTLILEVFYKSSLSGVELIIN